MRALALRSLNRGRLDLLLGAYLDNDGNEEGGGGTPAWAAAREPLWGALLGNGGKGGAGHDTSGIRVGAPAEGDNIDFAWLKERCRARGLPPLQCVDQQPFPPRAHVFQHLVAGESHVPTAPALWARARPPLGHLGAVSMLRQREKAVAGSTP